MVPLNNGARLTSEIVRAAHAGRRSDRGNISPPSNSKQRCSRRLHRPDPCSSATYGGALEPLYTAFVSYQRGT